MPDETNSRSDEDLIAACSRGGGAFADLVRGIRSSREYPDEPFAFERRRLERS